MLPLAAHDRLIPVKVARSISKFVSEASIQDRLLCKRPGAAVGGRGRNTNISDSR